MDGHHPQPAAEERAAAGGIVPTMMSAFTRHRYGTVAELAVEAIPTPTPKPGEVLIKVGAAGLDRATLHLLDGRPYLARLALGLRRPTRTTMGQQVAGVVVAVGADVTELAVGDRVLGTAAGSFAEYAVASPATLARTPARVGDAEAATIGVSGVTAQKAVSQARIGPGARVLVLGASGAVGTFVVPLAHHLGARVTAVCSAAKSDLVAGLGAERVVDYRSTAIADLGGCFDAIIDIGGNRRLAELRGVLAPTGVLVIVGGEEGGPWLGGIGRNIAAGLLDRFTTQHLTWFFSTTTTQACAQVAALLDSGAVRPPIERQVGLHGATAAIADMHQGALRGHAIICP